MSKQEPPASPDIEPPARPRARGAELLLETFLFSSRWLLAPLYVALVIALCGLLVKAAQHTWHFLTHILSSTESEMILGLLSLVDLTLTGSLVIIVIFSGYENFVSRIDLDEHKDWPEWMGTIDFAGLKLKLLSSIVAISAVQLLRAFLDLKNVSDRELYWQAGIHVVFIFSGLFMAWTDKISGEGKH